MINVILAEHHVIVRKAMKSLLEKESDITVTGEADNGEQVLELIKNNVEANVVMMEVDLPGLHGVELITKLKEASPDIKVAFLSVLTNESDILNAFNAGANGYLNKSVNVNELLFALRHIKDGGTYLCSASSLTLLNKIQNLPVSNIEDVIPDVDFSTREVEILALMADGFTNQEIAEKLFTSKRTVESHRQNMINKTGSRNTAALIKYALKNDIIN